MKHAEYKQWAAWETTQGFYLLSDESCKKLTPFRDIDELINYLWFVDKEAARTLNNLLKS